ncbi:NAD(+)/NADH kinase [Candidatus Woesearchaeota archaeon]|nr:NAD(+)/NADH kinase [Candidatus Woesearchaeota archaeon]
MKITDTLVVYTIPRSKEQKSNLELVKNSLMKHKIDYKLANRDRLRKAYFQNKDLIIAVGGDGTFLRAAHFAGKQLLLGVNSDTKNKEGFFMKADKNNFEKKLKSIIKNKFVIKKLQRLEACINNKKVDVCALNEFFVGARKSYHAAKYIIWVGNEKERQKSSGVLIATPSGSRAWAKSCCSRTLPLSSNKFQFVVREPYEGKVFKDYRLKYGILDEKQEISLVSEMLEGVIVADSVSREYKFKAGSKAIIKLSRNYLNAIW